MAFPHREYEHLPALADCWRVPIADIEHFVEIGKLQCCVWLAQTQVEIGQLRRCENGRNVFVAENRSYIEGFVGLRPQDCRRLFRDKRTESILFVSLRQPDCYLQLVEPNPVTILSSEIVVMQEERKQFEHVYGITCSTQAPTLPPATLKPPPNFKHNHDFTDVIIAGEHFRLGVIQSKIVAQLYDAYQRGDPWVHGKILLYNAGSQSERLKSVFNSQANWRKLIESDRRGYYRLQL